MAIKLLTAVVSVARLLISSRKAMKEAREAMSPVRSGAGMGDEERMRLVSMEGRLKELEARLEASEGSVRKLTTALYALAAVAIAALALAIIRLA